MFNSMLYGLSEKAREIIEKIEPAKTSYITSEVDFPKEVFDQLEAFVRQPDKSNLGRNPFGLEIFSISDDDPRISLHGQQGVRATRYIPKGSILCFYPGIVRCTSELKEHNFYILDFPWDEKKYSDLEEQLHIDPVAEDGSGFIDLDGKSGKGLAYTINANTTHGYFEEPADKVEANCAFGFYMPKGQKLPLGFVATTKDLSLDEELLIDYGENYWEFLYLQKQADEAEAAAASLIAMSSLMEDTTLPSLPALTIIPRDKTLTEALISKALTRRNRCLVPAVKLKLLDLVANPERWENFIAAGFTADHCVKIAGHHGGSHNLTKVLDLIENPARWMAFTAAGFTADHCVKIAGHDGGSHNLTKVLNLIEDPARWAAFTAAGFTADHCVTLTGNNGGSHNLTKVLNLIEDPARWAAFTAAGFTADHCVTIAGNHGGSHNLTQVLDLVADAERWEAFKAAGFTADHCVKIAGHDGGSHNLTKVLNLIEDPARWTAFTAAGFTADHCVKIAGHDGGSHNLTQVLDLIENPARWAAFIAAGFTADHCVKIAGHEGGSHNLTKVLNLIENPARWTAFTTAGFTADHCVKIAGHDGGSHNLTKVLNLIEDPARWAAFIAAGFTADHCVTIAGHGGGSHNLTKVLNLIEDPARWSAFTAAGFTADHCVTIAGHDGGSHNLTKVLDLIENPARWSAFIAAGFTADHCVKIAGHGGGSHNLTQVLDLVADTERWEAFKAAGFTADYCVKIVGNKGGSHNLTKVLELIEDPARWMAFTAAGFTAEHCVRIAGHDGGSHNLAEFVSICHLEGLSAYLENSPESRNALLSLANANSRSAYLEKLKFFLNDDLTRQFFFENPNQFCLFCGHLKQQKNKTALSEISVSLTYVKRVIPMTATSKTKNFAEKRAAEIEIGITTPALKTSLDKRPNKKTKTKPIEPVGLSSPDPHRPLIGILGPLTMSPEASLASGKGLYIAADTPSMVPTSLKKLNFPAVYEPT